MYVFYSFNNKTNFNFPNFRNVKKNKIIFVNINVYLLLVV